ncbi:unnamed protein product, partial [Microthlaspi erraticum]
ISVPIFKSCKGLSAADLLVKAAKFLRGERQACGGTNTIQCPLPLNSLNSSEPICLNGNLHWLGQNLEDQEVVVSVDFYASDHQHQVIPLPDSDKEPHFERSCTTSQGDHMYMNIISGEKDDGGDVDHKLSVWRLKNRGGMQWNWSDFELCWMQWRDEHNEFPLGIISLYVCSSAVAVSNPSPATRAGPARHLHRLPRCLFLILVPQPDKRYFPY